MTLKRSALCLIMMAKMMTVRRMLSWMIIIAMMKKKMMVKMRTMIMWTMKSEDALLNNVGGWGCPPILSALAL